MPNIETAGAEGSGAAPAGRGGPDRADCHGLLLRMAGRLPDAAVARERAALADDAFDAGRFAARVAAAVAESGVPVTSGDRALLAGLLAEAGGDPTLLDGVRVGDTVPVGAGAGRGAGRGPGPGRGTAGRKPDSAPKHLFAPAPMAVLQHMGDRVAPCLDLTFGPDSLISGDLTDAVDDAAGAAVSAAAGAVGLWRAWRFPIGGGPGPAEPTARPAPGRVLLVEVGPSTEPWPVAAMLQGILAGLGETGPLVEVFTTGYPLPAYQADALAYSALVWAAEPGVAIGVAEVFDHGHPDGLGSFDPDHPIVTDDQERGLLLSYLDGGVALATTDATAPDVLDPARGGRVPLTVRTDGAWIWTDAVSHYLRRYGLSPDPELAAHIREQRRPPARLDGVALFRALNRLQRSDDAERVGR